MIESTHKRCGHRIQDEQGNVAEYASINAAKRESRKLGLGTVSVVARLHNIGRVTRMFKAQSGHDIKANPMPSAA
jgi:hypothetical protein